MPLRLKETQAVSELASAFYDFLPATAHPFAPGTFTFGEAAARVGAQRYWQSGSKLPAVTKLLEAVWEFMPASLEPLILTVIREGIKYRANKGERVTREELERINGILLRLELKIPELVDEAFLAGLPRSSPAPSETATDEKTSSQAIRVDAERLAELRTRYTNLVTAADARARGYQLEKLLSDLFDVYGLAPRGAFRLIGEQIDGSFEFQGETYLLEARWREQPAAAADLYAFQEKVERKSAWTRGVFVSINGFSPDALEAFSRGKAPRIFGIDGADLAIALEGIYPLPGALRRKLRALSDSGTFLYQLRF